MPQPPDFNDNNNTPGFIDKDNRDALGSINKEKTWVVFQTQKKCMFLHDNFLNISLQTKFPKSATLAYRLIL